VSCDASFIQLVYLKEVLWYLLKILKNVTELIYQSSPQLRSLSPRANYTDRANRRLSGKLVPTFVGRRVSRGQHNGSLRPYSRLSRPEIYYLPLIIHGSDRKPWLEQFPYRCMCIRNIVTFTKPLSNEVHRHADLREGLNRARLWDGLRYHDTQTHTKFRKGGSGIQKLMDIQRFAESMMNS
jgi:hypothetical protein